MMSEENARRLAERIERDRPRIATADVEEYRRIHYPEFDFVLVGHQTDIPRIPGDEYIAALDHGRFHEWFGTECDATCPHRKRLPIAELPRRQRRPWWKRLLGLGASR